MSEVTTKDRFHGRTVSATAKPRLVIFDFDGTLFDTHTSIAHCISLTFAQLSKAPPPSASAIKSTIATGVGLEETFQMLHESYPPANKSSEEASGFTRTNVNMSTWIDTYRSLYASEGLPLISPFPGAVALLETLSENGVGVVVVSNKGIQAVEAVLQNARMEGLVQMVVGDMPGVPRKPNPASYFDIIAPRFTAVEPEHVLVVGDTSADILFARNIGGISCWARYGYGEKEKCEMLDPDFVVDSLNEVWSLIGRGDS